jgi:hypothetical protein
MTSGFITLRREVMKHKFIIGGIAVGIVVVLMTINGVVRAQGIPNWNASPLNFDNSPLNFNNSPLNFNNSPMNWNNSPLNINSNNGIYDNKGNRTGYAVPSPSGTVNYYNNNGNRIGYGPNGR